MASGRLLQLPRSVNPSEPSIPLSTPTPAQRRCLRKIMHDFHIRAFGEEMARINFLPEKRRKAAVAEMIDHARRKGVNLSAPPWE
jgi:hypothetical protein